MSFLWEHFPSLRDVVAAESLSAKKSLGQHFLLDYSVLKRIIDAVSHELRDVCVVEVGPGPGGLTRAILETQAREVVVIEKDTRFFPIYEAMQERVGARLRVLEADALTCAPQELTGSPCAIISNLPYNISVPLTLRWIQDPTPFRLLLLMYQKEVADRLLAQPRTSDYGRLSVMIQWRMHVERVMNLAPGAFVPAPKVASTVVKLTPKDYDDTVTWDTMEQVTFAAFNNRRKMLRVSLKSLGIDTLLLLDQAAIAPTKRAEELTVEEFCLLAKVFETLKETQICVKN